MKASLALLVVLGLLPMAQAQSGPPTPPTPPKMGPHHGDRFTTLLSLNPAQVEQATTFFTAEATARENAHASQRAAHQALEAAIKSNDTATIQSTAATLGQMETEMLTAHSMAQAQFYAMLSTDQKAKFSELEGGHMMFGPGRGGPPMR
jgi:Spy/CpxP family protein refolding chaperone